MPEIRPFRAWRYRAQKVKNASLVVAPPYDVISKEEQTRLYDASPYNVVRMELGKEHPGDTSSDNRYTRAKKFLEDMKSEGVVTREEAPALYVYAQDYEEEGKKKTRLGFFAAMKLDEKAVLKHENTLAGPKEDRLHLLKAVRTNLSPIFGLFEDKTAGIQTLLKQATLRTPVLDARVAGVRHRLYLEQRPDALRTIVSKMKSKPMFIADGHHRFEVACQFRRWMRGQGSASATKRGGHKAWDYALVYFSDCRHNPFKIFPTHRLIRISDNKPLSEILKKAGTLKPCREHACVFPTKKYQYGVYSNKEGFFTFTLSPKIASRIDKRDPVERLDVAVLHEHILGPCFGIHEIEKSLPGRPAGDAIDFTRDAKDACRKVQSGLFDAAFFLRPTSLDDMLLVSKKGLKMPQKSTYFHPKLLTGLVFYGFEENGNGS